MLPLILLFHLKGSPQDQPVIDSIKHIIATSEDDTIKIDALMDLGDQYKNTLPDTAMIYYKKAFELSDRIGLLDCKASCLRLIGIVYEYKGLYDKALTEYFNALSVFEEIEDTEGIGNCYNDIAIIHLSQGSYERCIEYLSKSYKIKEELGDKEGIANYYTNLASVKVAQGLYESACDCVLKSVEIFEEIDDKEGIAIGFGNLGAVNFFLGNYKKSLEYHLKSIEPYRELNNKDGLAHAYNNISSVFAIMADSVARTKEERIQYLEEAVPYGIKSLETAREIDALYLENVAAKTLKDIYTRLGDYKIAMEYAELFFNTNDSLFSQEKTMAIQEMETKYETEKKQQQIELQDAQLATKDLEIKQQKTLRNALITGLGLFVAVIILTLYAYMQKRKDNRIINRQKEDILQANRELNEYNEEISAQRDEIENQRDEIEAQRDEITRQRDLVLAQKEGITDSIRYAQLIQNAVLPHQGYLDQVMPDYFVFFKPRDIVSGDFYWIKQVKNYLVVVVADCTGHGVPGAFMSMLGISLLNEHIGRARLDKPGEVLNRLRRKVKDTLAQEGKAEEQKDGMDIAMVMINTETRELDFAGAFSPLYLIRPGSEDTEGSITENASLESEGYRLYDLKGDRQPIGVYSRESDFTTRHIELKQDDTIYLFSDGFADQIGGPDGKKFMNRKFKSALLGMQELSMEEQKERLNEILESWMGNYDQVDDILVMGIRV